MGDKVPNKLLILLDLLFTDPLHPQLIQQRLPTRVDVNAREPFFRIITHMGDVLERFLFRSRDRLLIDPPELEYPMPLLLLLLLRGSDPGACTGGVRAVAGEGGFGGGFKVFPAFVHFFVKVVGFYLGGEDKGDLDLIPGKRVEELSVLRVLDLEGEFVFPDDSSCADQVDDPEPETTDVLILTES